MILHQEISQYYTLPSKSFLYHGTSIDFDPHDIEAPLWLSESIEVARYFCVHNNFNKVVHDSRVLKFQTIHDIPLVLILDQVKYLEIQKIYSTVDQWEIAELMEKDGCNGWIIPENYTNDNGINGSDILLTNHAIKYLKFIKHIPYETR